MLRTRSNMGFSTKWQVTPVNSPIWPEFIREFMPVQIICTFHNDTVKTK